MQGRHEMIPSRPMGRHMHVWCYGHWGMPVVVFPTAAGFAHEWSAQGMLEPLAHLIGSGRIKLYCPESNISRTWTAKEEDLAVRMQRHKDYEAFILEELVPYIRNDCRAPEMRMAATGCSLGGFYAANFALKYPTIFNYALCMSGRYQMTAFTNGHSNPDVYFNNPLAFVAQLNGPHLEAVRDNTHVTLVCGQGPWEEGCIEETIQLGELLAAKQVPHTTDIWGHDVSHNWVWWQRQAKLHLGQRFAG